MRRQVAHHQRDLAVASLVGEVRTVEDVPHAFARGVDEQQGLAAARVAAAAGRPVARRRGPLQHELMRAQRHARDGGAGETGRTERLADERAQHGRPVYPCAACVGPPESAASSAGCRRPATTPPWAIS